MSDPMRSLTDDLFAIYSRAGREVTYVTERGETRPYWANRYMQALKRAVDEQARGRARAILEFAERLVEQPEPSRGFHYLHAAGRLDLTVEAHVIDASRPYHSLFSPGAVEISRDRLAEYGFPVNGSAPVGPDVPSLVVLHYDVVTDRARTSLDRISSLRSLDLNLDSFLQTLVRDARSAGATWDEIGLRFGVSADDASARFGIRMSNGKIE
jgi:hypothetical protein